MDGHSSWSRAGDDRTAPGQADDWYGDQGWRGGGGEPAERYGEATERYHEPERYPDPPERYEEQRYDEPRADPLRADPGVTELPRVNPVRPEPGLADLPRAAAAPVAARAVPPLATEPAAPPPVPAPPPRRPMGAPGSPGPVGVDRAGEAGVYRSKRPATAALFGVVAGVLELPALRLLWAATFDDPVSVSGVVAAACLVCALPLAAVGLYAVATGAVRAAGPNSVQAWLRPPVAYLTVALVLFVAAGLAG